jgi:hypothetical protein
MLTHHLSFLSIINVFIHASSPLIKLTVEFSPQMPNSCLSPVRKSLKLMLSSLYTAASGSGPDCGYWNNTNTRAELPPFTERMQNRQRPSTVDNDKHRRSTY